MTHYKIYSGNDKREDRYERHTAILIQRREPEEEEEVIPEPTSVGRSSMSVQERQELQNKEDTYRFIGDTIGSALAMLFRRL